MTLKYFLALSSFFITANVWAAAPAKAHFTVEIKSACAVSKKHGPPDTRACEGWRGDAVNAIYKADLEAPFKKPGCPGCVDLLAFLHNQITVKNTVTGELLALQLELALSMAEGNGGTLYDVSVYLNEVAHHTNTGTVIATKDLPALASIGLNGPDKRFIRPDGTIVHLGTVIFVTGVQLLE
jgi:hypothetical protein